MLLGVPYIYNQTPLMLVDIPAMFFLSQASLLTLQALKRENLFYGVLAGVGIVLAMLSKYSLWLMLTIVPVIMMSEYLSNKQQRAKVVAQIVTISCCVFVLC